MYEHVNSHSARREEKGKTSWRGNDDYGGMRLQVSLSVFFVSPSLKVLHVKELETLRCLHSCLRM